MIIIGEMDLFSINMVFGKYYMMKSFQIFIQFFLKISASNIYMKASSEHCKDNKLNQLTKGVIDPRFSAKIMLVY